MVRKHDARRRSRASLGVPAPSQERVSGGADEYDVLNPAPSMITIDRTAVPPDAVILCDSVKSLETAPGKWRSMASSMAQCVVLCKRPTMARLAWLSPIGIPCQVCHAIVNKTHAYIPNVYLADGAFKAMVEPLKMAPVVALSAHVIPFDGDVSSLLRTAAVRQTLRDLFVVDQQTVRVEVMGESFLYRIHVREAHLLEATVMAQSIVYRLTSSTDIIISAQKPQPLPDTAAEAPLPIDEGLSDVGGLAREVSSICEFATLCLHRSDWLSRLSVAVSCKGLLLHGPPGTGKSLIASRLAKTMNATFFPVDSADCVSGVVGVSEYNLRRIFENALSQAPSIIFLDEIDVLCPKTTSGSIESTPDSAMSVRMASTLCSLFDTLSKASRVLVLAATNRPGAVAASLRRPGRFDREVLIGVPNPSDRLAILEVIVKELGTEHDICSEDLKVVADSAHGFVGADLRALVQEAVLSSLRRQSARCHGDDLHRALNVIRPSALRENVIEVPKVLWKDIGGQDDAKATLKEVVEWPLKYPESFARLGVRPPRGVLLYGPPGCSKTMMARALATESSLNFIAIKGPELLSKWVGDSEKALRDVFDKARASAPAIVFFDEIDSIASARSGMGGGGSSSGVVDRVLSQLLSELDGVEAHGSVIVVAATNRPASLDPALLRPGRIDRLCYVSLPDRQARVQILSIHLSKYSVEKSLDVDEVVEQTDGFSGAEIGAICREAAMKAIEDYDRTGKSPEISKANLLAALAEARPRTSPDALRYFESFASSRQTRQ